MIGRRPLLQGLSGLSLAAPVVAATPSHPTGMKHRSYAGTVAYTNNGRQNGQETFSCTIQPNGLRTLRVQCEMDDDRLLRDVVMTLDKDWRPQHAFVQLTVAEQFVGATWFHFDPEAATAEGFTVNDGRVSQRFPVSRPVEAFVAHPIHGDSWTYARVRRAAGQGTAAATPEFSSSLMANGGSGPVLVPFPPNYFAYTSLGREKITVAAGTFMADHFQMTVVPKNKTMDVWSLGDDCIPIRLATQGKSYDLATLSGDPR